MFNVLTNLVFFRDPNHGDSASSQFPAGRYSLVTVPSVCHPNQRVYTGYIRRRLGRGGRIIYDRLRPPSDLAEFLRIYDRERQCFLPERLAFPRENEDCRTYSCIPRPQCRDQALLQRLKPLVLGSSCNRPSYNWPICTDFSTTPSFEPLHPGIDHLSTTSFNRSCAPTAPDHSTFVSPLESPDGSSKTNGPSETLDDLIQYSTAFPLDVDSSTKETNGYQSPKRNSVLHPVSIRFC